MKLNAKELNNLRPVEKMKRTKIDNYNLVCEQSQKAIIFLFKYKSPINNKTRLLKLRAFDYQEFKADDIKQLKVMEAKHTTLVEVKEIDRIKERKQKAIKEKSKVLVSDSIGTIT